MCVRRKGSVYRFHKCSADSELDWNGPERSNVISHIFIITLMCSSLLLSLRQRVSLFYYVSKSLDDILDHTSC